MDTHNPTAILVRHLRSIALLNLIVVLANCSPDRPSPPRQNRAWAYATSLESYFEMPAGKGPFHVPGSSLAFSQKQVSDDENPVDWFPKEHATPPFAVAHQRPHRTIPCAECHLYNGQGFLGAADLNGLTAP